MNYTLVVAGPNKQTETLDLRSEREAVVMIESLLYKGYTKFNLTAEHNEETCERCNQPSNRL